MEEEESMEPKGDPRSQCRRLDIEFHPCGLTQKRFLVHLWDDVVWCDSWEAALVAIKTELEHLGEDESELGRGST